MKTATYRDRVLNRTVTVYSSPTKIMPMAVTIMGAGKPVSQLGLCLVELRTPPILTVVAFFN